MKKFGSLLIVILLLSLTGSPTVTAEADSSFSDNRDDAYKISTNSSSRVSEIVVNSSGDASDDDDGAGVCETIPGTGICTLRAAIETANFGVINPVKIVVNTPSVWSIAPNSPLPEIMQDNVTIMGNGVFLSGLNAGEASGFKINGGSNNKIQGFNIFGFEKHGIHIYSYHNNIIGVDGDGDSDAEEGNYIYSNDQYGVFIELGNNNRVSGNYIGLNTAGVGPNQTGVWIGGGTGSLIGTNGDGISDTLERNVISGNEDDGIRILTNSNRVAGNYIGTNPSGEASAGNQYGIELAGTATGNIIGTNGDGQGDDIEGNLISGNEMNGVVINNEADNNWVAGNIIGLNHNGSSAVPNGYSGILVKSADNTIGRNIDFQSDNFEGNIISGNDTSGIQLVLVDAQNNEIYGNFIGLSASGMTAIGNGADGIEIRSGADNNEIGCSGSPCRNVISGNNSDGIYIENSNYTVIKGNLIGTDKNGLSAIPNGDGIYIKGSSSGNSIGGTVVGARNIISGNSRNGIKIYNQDATANDVWGNYIGVGVNGTTPLGNGASGVQLSDSPFDNSIGSTSTGTGNIIAYNGQSGVFVSGFLNSVRKNNIFENGGRGINLSDTDANNGQEYPEISSATLLDSGDLLIEGLLTSTANMDFEIDFFVSETCDTYGFGEGEHYLETKSLVGTPSGQIVFSQTLSGSFTLGHVITATATDSDGNTSEFSACIVIVPEAEPGEPVNADFFATPTSGEVPLLVTFLNQSTGDFSSCTWNFGDGGTNSKCATPQHTYQTTGQYTVSLTVSGDGGTDTYTRENYIQVIKGSNELNIFLPLILR